MTTATKTRLGDLGTGHVWFTSVGHPAGCDLIAEEGEPLDLPGEYGAYGDESSWWDLEGTVEGNKWTWDGEGEPHDERFNTVTAIVAFVPHVATTQKLAWTELGYQQVAELSAETGKRLVAVDDGYICHYAAPLAGMTPADTVADYAAGYDTDSPGEEMVVTCRVFERGEEVYCDRHTFIEGD